MTTCQHRDDGRGVCIDCGEFLRESRGEFWSSERGIDMSTKQVANNIWRCFRNGDERNGAAYLLLRLDEAERAGYDLRILITALLTTKET